MSYAWLLRPRAGRALLLNSHAWLLRPRAALAVFLNRGSLNPPTPPSCGAKKLDASSKQQRQLYVLQWLLPWSEIVLRGRKAR